MYKILFVQGF